MRLPWLGHDAPAIDAFNGRVNRRTEQYFGALVPVLEGFKTVSIHRLRALYGAIIIHYFCPEHQNEHRFLQHYLGHLLEEQGRKLPNAAATQHYFHYRLVNDQGKLLTARGLKVMANGLPPTPTDNIPIDPDLTALAMEAQSGGELVTESEPEPETQQRSHPYKRGVIRINGYTRDRWLAVLHHLAPEGTSQHAKMAVLLEHLEAQLQGDVAAEPAPTDRAIVDTAVEAEPEVSELVEVNLPVKEQTINYQAQTLAWLTTEVAQLRRQITQLQAERDTVVAIAPPAPALEAELAQLRAENVQLRQAQAKLEAFRKLLTKGNGQEDVPGPALATTEAPPTVVAKPTMKQPIAGDTKQTTTPAVVKPATQPQRRRPIGAQARATGILQAVCQWNDTPGRTLADKWCVTSSLLETQFGIHRQAVKEWFAAHGSEVAAMHSEHGITHLRTQNRGKDITALKAFIANQQLEA